MQVRTPSIGEVEEVGQRAVEAGQTIIATGNLEALDKSIAESKEMIQAVDAHLSGERAWQQLQALLADAMERGEREAFDAHYDSQTLPGELDVVEPDPWVEDKEAAIADEH